MRIDINADAGESYGRWVLGDDEALFPHVTSLNAACGYHGGDPGWMRRSVKLAKSSGVDLGAHPGFPDLLGFGRRAIAASHEEIIDMVVYQVGALLAFAKAEGVPVTHVKPHAMLGVAIVSDSELLLKYADAVNDLQAGIDLTLASGGAFPGTGVGTGPAELLRDRGFNTRAEVVADMEYDDDGLYVAERVPQAKDPDYVAQRALAIAHGNLVTVSGSTIEVKADTLCIHGDRPNATQIAVAIGRTLREASIEVSPMSTWHRAPTTGKV